MQYRRAVTTDLRHELNNGPVRRRLWQVGWRFGTIHLPLGTREVDTQEEPDAGTGGGP
jgi:hypothetical protein